MPEGWCWTTLADISNYGECINVPVDKIPDSSWILELEDIEKDSGRLIQRRIKSNKIINGVRHSFTKSNILYSKLRTYLNKVLIADQDGYCTTEIIPITCKKGIMPEYLCHVLRSSYYVGYTISLGYGVKMPRLGTTDALKSMIPVPPTSEQARIVSAIDKLSSTIDILEANQQDALDIADRTKAKILDLALTGKLVPQDPLDEPATRLLTRINPLYKSCDNRHYENLPSGWQEVAFDHIFKSIPTKRFQVQQKEIQPKGTIPVISQSANYIEGYTDDIDKIFTATPVIVFGDHTRVVKFVDFPFVVGADGVKIYSTKIFPPYGYYLIEHAAHNIENKGYGRHSQYIAKQRYPLPPFDEQKRTVESVRKMFMTIDSIVADL